MTSYDPAGWRAKWLALWLAWLAPAVPGTAQEVHIIRLEVDSDQEVYRFVPARVTARPGDVLRFRVSSGPPHNVAFDGDRLSASAHEALNSAMPNRIGDLSGPILDRVGAEYRVVVPQLPAGHYGFYCTPHRAYDMRGELIVVR